MPRQVELTAKQVSDYAKAKGQYKNRSMLCVSKNLYLKRSSGGNCFWLYRQQKPLYIYQFAPYELMSLAEARARAREIERILFKGENPKAEKQNIQNLEREKREVEEEKSRTFARVAQLWLVDAERKNKWANDSTGRKHAETNLRLHILNVVGDVPIRQFSWQHVLKVMLEDNLYQDHPSMARKCRAIINSVCSFAKSKGWTSIGSPATIVDELKYELSTIKQSESQNQPALSFKKIPIFFKELHQRSGIGAKALEFAILTAARSGQIQKSRDPQGGDIRGLRWEHLDLENAVWNVPKELMKQKRPFTSYLPAQAVELLRTLPRHYGCPWVFSKDGKRPISNGTMLKVIREMNIQRLRQGLPMWVDVNSLDKQGKPRQITVHGTARAAFRSWAQDFIYQRKEPKFEEIAERCLSHMKKDSYGGAYLRWFLDNSHLYQELMNYWGAYCYSEIDTDEK